MADNGARAELWRNLALTSLGFGFAVWAFVLDAGTDRIIDGQETIQRRQELIENRLNSIEQRVGAVELTLADRPPRWLLERVERLERQVESE